MNGHSKAEGHNSGSRNNAEVVHRKAGNNARHRNADSKNLAGLNSRHNARRIPGKARGRKGNNQKALNKSGPEVVHRKAGNSGHHKTVGPARHNNPKKKIDGNAFIASS